MTWVDTVLSGRTIRWFLAVVAVYLGYQIWLNARYYGTSWPCWDYMLISGFLAFLVAVHLATGIDKRLDTAIDLLRLNNALILTDEGVARLKQEMAQRGKSIQLWSGVLIGLLVFGCYVWVFGALARQIWAAWRQGLLPEGGPVLVELGIFTLISALAAVLAGLFFGRLTHYGTLARVLSTDEASLRIVPGHFDGASGLKPIGDFYLFQALLLAIPILWLGAWWAWVIPTYKDVVCGVTGQPQMLFREWQGPFFVQWLVVLGYFYTGFVGPVLALRRRIRATRARLQGDEAGGLERNILAQQRRLIGETGQHTSALAQDIDRAARHLWSIRAMGDWPMDFATLAKYRSVLVGEVLLPVAAAAASPSGLGGAGPTAVQWLKSWLGVG